MTYFGIFFNIHLNILRKLCRFLMFFEKHIKIFLNIFKKKQWSKWACVVLSNMVGP